MNKMNKWTEISAEFAQQRNYLDELYKVYPITPNLRREISTETEKNQKFNNKYVIGEAKFLTDFGGHQNAQFDDAVRTMQSSFEYKNVCNEVVPIAVMDGVLYISGNNKMYRYLQNNSNQIILSALVLREFLYSL